MKKKKPKQTRSLKNLQRKPVSLWDLDKDGVTQSFLGAFEECPEQTSLRYIDGYTPKNISVPLEFGTVMHYCIERQFLESSPEHCAEKITSAYRKYRLPTLRNTSEQDSLEFILSLVEVTFPEYCKYWSEDDQSMDWIVREGKFKVPFPIEAVDGPRTISLQGMRDGLYRNPEGHLGIFETKNKSKISEQEIRNSLRADMQTLFYAFATYLETGEIPTRVTYNVIRRSDMYRRSSGNEPMSVYIKRISDDIKSRPAFYFQRFGVELLESDLKKFRDYTLIPLLIRVVQWWDSIKKNPTGRNRWQSPYHYQSLRNLIGKYGKSDMWPLIVEGSRNLYYTRKTPFLELNDYFQDTVKKQSSTIRRKK